MYIIFMIVLIFFALVGLYTLISSLAEALYKGGGNAVLVLSELTQDNAEMRIRTAARICLRHTGIRLICLIKESDAAYDICRLLESDYPFMEITDSFHA